MGDRLTSLALDALEGIQKRILTEPMAEAQGIPVEKWDLKVTKVVTGYDRVLALRVRNV